MRATYWLIAVTLALLSGGCASIDPSPSPEVRQTLAPTGKLRVGVFAANPIHAIKDPVSGELKGPAIDLGREMARRIGVAFEPVAYPAIPPLLAGAEAGEWDIAMMGIGPERAKLVDFTRPFIIVEFAYLLPAGSPISSAADLDRPDVRIGVVEKSTPDVYLSRTLKRATLMRFPAPADMLKSLQTGNAHAIYGVKANIALLSGKIPGSRLLDDRGGEETAIALPKGREAGAVYAQQFVERAKRDGFVKTAIEKAGVTGVVVAPAK